MFYDNSSIAISPIYIASISFLLFNIMKWKHIPCANISDSTVCININMYNIHYSFLLLLKSSRVSKYYYYYYQQPIRITDTMNYYYYYMISRTIFSNDSKLSDSIIFHYNNHKIFPSKYFSILWISHCLENFNRIFFYIFLTI